MKPDYKIRRLAEIANDIRDFTILGVEDNLTPLCNELDTAIVYAAGKYDGLLSAFKKSGNTSVRFPVCLTDDDAADIRNALINRRAERRPPPEFETPETDAQFLHAVADAIEKHLNASPEITVTGKTVTYDAARLRRIADRIAP